MDSSDITKTTGTVKISPDKDDYFYHMGEWIDLNGDGRKDFITARSNAKAGEGERFLARDPWSRFIGSAVGMEVNLSFPIQKLTPRVGWGFSKTLSMVWRFLHQLIRS